MQWIFIPGNVPSLKNGKEIVQIPMKGAKPCPVCKKRKSSPRLVSSKRHKAYAKSTGYLYKAQANAFKALAAKATPSECGRIYVALHFVRDSRRAWDFTNATDTVQDLMVEHGWVDDDNINVMVPVFAGCEVDKSKPGVYIGVFDAPKSAQPEKAQGELF